MKTFKWLIVEVVQKQGENCEHDDIQETTGPRYMGEARLENLKISKNSAVNHLTKHRTVRQVTTTSSPFLNVGKLELCMSGLPAVGYVFWFSWITTRQASQTSSNNSYYHDLYPSQVIKVFSYTL